MMNTGWFFNHDRPVFIWLNYAYVKIQTFGIFKYLYTLEDHFSNQ